MDSRSALKLHCLLSCGDVVTAFGNLTSVLKDLKSEIKDCHANNDNVSRELAESWEDFDNDIVALNDKMDKVSREFEECLAEFDSDIAATNGNIDTLKEAVQQAFNHTTGVKVEIVTRDG